MASASFNRRGLLCAASAACALPWQRARAAAALTISGAHGQIDFAIGDSKIFRTTGSFKDWRGTVEVDDLDIPKSSVNVTVNTKSIAMPDEDQTEMLKDSDFFDVDKFPEMTFHSNSIERAGEQSLKVGGIITLRGIERPMMLDISVTDRKPDAAPGARYARFRGRGTLKRSEFGMTKYVEVVGDTVDIYIRADARR